MNNAAKNLGFNEDLAACIELSDARRRENAQARVRAMANPELAAELARDSMRRGLPGIDWTGYFQNLGINYP
jgi:hypothetical protein